MSTVTQQLPVETTPEVELTPPQSTPARHSETPSSPADRFYRLSLEQYHRMAEQDILGPDDRVELIEGLLIKKMTKRPPHNIATDLLENLLHRVVLAGWFVSMQNPIALAEAGSEPEPDAKIVRGTPRDFKERRIGPTDVGLIVEVADSSLRDDQVVKKELYARSSIPVYWIVNIPTSRLEVYTDPTGSDPSPDYRRRVDLGPADQVMLTLDGGEVAQITVADLLP